MKILITGGTGFIGRHLAAYWQHSQHQLTVLARHIDASLFGENVGCLEVDITVQEDIQAAIIFLQPDVVIHTAALSKPNDCEGDKEQCYLTNVTATAHIVEGCKAVGAKLIFLSTDFVFGNNGPYSEADGYEPVNYYGESKALAEELITASGLPHAIIRTVLVVGSKLPDGPGTFLHWVKDSLITGKTIQVYTDQLRSVTYVADLCRGIDTIVETGFEGTVHLCGDEVFTPYSLAQQLANELGLNKNLIQPVTAQQRPEPALRPQNSVLTTDKAKQFLGYQTTSLQEVVHQIFSESLPH
jgi:dTDP-4-dehydrorhamnose reductase